VAREPYFSAFLEKLKPDLEYLRHSNDFGQKIFHRLVRQYPQLVDEQERAFLKQQVKKLKSPKHPKKRPKKQHYEEQKWF
jgi:hypothetical protein